MRRFYCLFAFLIILLSGCAGWTTRYSRASASGVSVNLYKDGKLIFGPCGLGRVVDDEYEFRMAPGLHRYSNAEIEMYRSNTPIPAHGEITLDQDFRHMDIDIQVEINGAWANFSGNGQYSINASD